MLHISLLLCDLFVKTPQNADAHFDASTKMNYALPQVSSDSQK